MTAEERTRHDQRVDAEIAKLINEAGKLPAERVKIEREAMLYPMVAASGATLAIVAVVKLFL